MKQISTMVLKIISICAFIRIIGYIQPILVTVLYNKRNQSLVNASIVPYAAVLMIITLLAIALWVFADRISELILKDTNQKLNISVNLTGLQALAFNVVGVIIVFSSLPQLISTIIEIISNKDIYMKNTILLAKSNLILESLKFLLGLFLAFGASWIVKFFKKIGNASFYNYEDEYIEIKEDENNGGIER